MITKINPEIIELDKNFQGICKKPYHGHAKGCPNYGKRKDCPPNLSLLDDSLDFEKDMYLIYTSYPVGKFAERMRKTHSEWTDRQIYNPRLWQPTARKKHREEIQKFMEMHPQLYVETNAEARGTNFTALMKTQGIDLNWQWPPEHNLENITYRISIGGMKK